MEEYWKNSEGDEAEGSYYVGPPSMVEQEIEDEQNYNFHGVLDDDEYDLEEYFDDEPVASAVEAKVIEASVGTEREGWMAATRDELSQIEERGVKTDYRSVDFNEKYGFQGVKKMFSKVVATKKPLHYGKGGWKQKIRICVCGNGEEGTYGQMDENRAEVPSTFEMKTLLALAERKNWVVGALDIKTAFLHAELDDREDGVYRVYPPKLLVRNGLVANDTVWKLEKVLYGLRAGPKKWTEH